MRRINITLLIVVSFMIRLNGQERIYEQEHDKWSFVRETAFGAGIGLSGNSIFGAEIQAMFVPHWSGQLGIGNNSFSCGFNYHIFPTVRSPYISLQAWQQGFGTNYKAAYAGAMFVYRADKLVQAGLGLGYKIHTPSPAEQGSGYILMLNLGIYLPF